MVTVQMLMARAEGRDEDKYMDQLELLWPRLSEGERDALLVMGKDWATQT